MKCPTNQEISCPYWELPFIKEDVERNLIYKFKEYLIEHFYMARPTADDVFERYFEKE